MQPAARMLHIPHVTGKDMTTESQANKGIRKQVSLYLRDSKMQFKSRHADSQGFSLMSNKPCHAVSERIWGTRFKRDTETDRSRQRHGWVLAYDDDDYINKYRKLITSNHLHPLIYKVVNAYNMYKVLFINRHVECTFTCSSKGR